MLPNKFQVNWPFLVQKKQKIDYEDGRHLGFLIETILAMFDLQVILMIHTKFQVNWPFSAGEEANKVFKIAAMAAILDFRLERFYLFLIYKSPQCFLQSFKSISLSVRRRSEKQIFKMAATAANLDFR